jgi:hypothetical protein
MTSIINNENENIIFVQNEANKENCHNNMDEFINNQINIAKNHSKSKQIQANQINKGLNVLDPNNNCIKKPNSFIQNKPETKNDKNQNLLYYPFMELDSNYIFSKNDNYNSNNILNANQNANKNEEKIESMSNNSDDIEIVSSTKGNEENENMLIFSSPNFYLEDDECISEHKNFEENIKKIHDSLIKLDININKLAKKRESDNLLLKCGESSYKYNKALEESVFKIPSNFLIKQKINPYIRTKMIDWMIEVLSVFGSTEETFFLSVNIMDLFLWKTQTIYKSENVHLIGVAAMFIASKFQEIYPISLSQFVHKIGHDQFNASDIKKMECKILRDIKPECLVSTSVYDFSKTYFYDFYYNNKNLITSEEDGKIYQYIKYTSVYLNKLVLHYEFFYQENCSMKAIGCIVASIKIVGDYLNEKLPQKTKGIYNDWMLFLIEQGGFDKQKVELLANKIFTAYQHYQKSKSISRNLNRFTPLPFIKKKK